MMDERLAQLEVKSDSNATALAALENDMNDRFNRIETELSELRQNKADNDSTLYRLTNMQEEMNRRFGEVKEELQRRATELREHIDNKTTQAREENERRFAEARNENSRQFAQVDKHFEQVETSIADLRKELHHFSRWGLGLLTTIALAAISLVAKAFLG